MFHKVLYMPLVTAQKMKFSIKDFFTKCDKTRRKLCALHKIWQFDLNIKIKNHITQNRNNLSKK